MVWHREMKIAYLILAHTSPKQLARLVAALSSRRADFFIHVDQKTDIQPFQEIKGPGIRFSATRVPVYWGDYSMVEATLILLRSALDCDERFDRFVLLSGAEYPVRKPADIEKFFESNADDEFINLVSMPCDSAGKPISRLQGYQFRPNDGAARRVARKTLVKLGLLPRHRDYQACLGSLKPYGGSTWWALTRGAVQHIIDFTDSQREILEFFKNTFHPDESFFQTILGNSPFRQRIRRNLTYADWSKGGKSPPVLTSTDLAALQSAPEFPASDTYGPGAIMFARKFSDDSLDAPTT
jgi:hypothetical protein